MVSGHGIAEAAQTAEPELNWSLKLDLQHRISVPFSILDRLPKKEVYNLLNFDTLVL